MHNSEELTRGNIAAWCSSVAQCHGLRHRTDYRNNVLVGAKYRHTSTISNHVVSMNDLSGLKAALII